MTETIGNAWGGITLASNGTASLQNYYYTRFVSAPLSGVTSITAQTWTYNFAATQSSLSANFPCSGTNQPVRVTAYVWRPGTGKVGNILDGNSASTVNEGAASTITCHNVTFSGSLVSGVQDGDVICFEAIFQITQVGTTSRNDAFSWDGNTVNTTEGATVSNHAAFIETPQNLVGGTNYTTTLPTETVSISESVARQLGANRAQATETVTSSESIARMAVNSRALAAETIAVSESVARLASTPPYHGY